MSKLTPPAPQNRAKRKKFFEDNPYHPDYRKAMERIKKEEIGKARKGMMLRIKNYIRKNRGLKFKTKGAFGKLPRYLIKFLKLEVM